MKRIDFNVIYISLRVHPPDGILKRINNFRNIQYINGPVNRRNLFRSIYPNIDILCIPSYIDTFGYAFLEAMAFKKPCIGTNHFAIPEIISEGKTGLIINSLVSNFFNQNNTVDLSFIKNDKIISELSICLEKLLSSETLREKMGLEGNKQIVDGKFSICKRNKILKLIYELAESC